MSGEDPTRSEVGPLAASACCADLRIIALQAIDQARPDAAVTVLRSLLTDRLGALLVRLLLANYPLTALRPIQDPDDHDVPLDTPAGQAFVSQRPVTRGNDAGESELYLPISIRGDRMGVLQLRLPVEPAAEKLDELGDLATVIAYALQAAARQSDLLHRGSRSHRLTLAGELQWQLLPGRGARAPGYELAGHLEPAHHVHADNVDWSQDDGQLVLSVMDAARHGPVASLLTTLAVTALRNARRAGLDVADQAAMADQAVYAHHQGRQYVSGLLVRIDLATGRAEAVRAGSPRLFIVRGGEVIQPALQDQLPLGMFDESDYFPEHFALATGDRLVIVSDGIHGAISPDGRHFGDSSLPELLRETATAPIGGVVRRVIDGVFEHRDLAELDDDAAILCLDWSGPSQVDAAGEAG